MRDWLYVTDHCKAIDAVIHRGRAGEVYNVGGHNERRNIDIVRTIIRTVHELMTEHPEYREVLKKKEMGPDGRWSVDWINDDLITFVKDRLGTISVMRSTRRRSPASWDGVPRQVSMPVS